MAGNATLTTAMSRNATKEPRMLATRTRRWFRLMAPSSTVSRPRGKTGSLSAAPLPPESIAPSEWARRRDAPLVLEQPLLARKAAPIAGERPVRADHAVTRHDDADGIAPVREAHGSRRL